MIEAPILTHDPADYKGPSAMVHLHNHTVFSVLDGVATPEQYAEQCEKWGLPAMAATEHGHLASIPDMYLAFRAHKLKPVFGSEIYYNDWEPRRQTEVARGTKMKQLQQTAPELYNRCARNRHLTVLAKNKIGLENLIKLTTQAYQTGFWGAGRNKYNRIWFEKLCQYKEGLIVLSGCLNGPVCHELRFKQIMDKQDPTKVIWERSHRECIQSAAEYVKKFKSVFGDDYWIELQMPGIDGDVEVFETLVGLADFYRLKVVLANDCHYLKRADHELQLVMMAIEQGEYVDSPNLFHVNSSEQYMKSRAELWARFKSLYNRKVPDSVFEQACDNTLQIADQCENLVLDTSDKKPVIKNGDRELIKLVDAELKRRGLDKVTRRWLVDGREVTYKEQAVIELDRFISKGFSSYFLITQDLVKFGRGKGWPFSPRGSAAGSLVCHLLGIITGIDPLKWGLSFDRFLSPSRGGYILDVRMPAPKKAA